MMKVGVSDAAVVVVVVTTALDGDDAAADEIGAAQYGARSEMAFTMGRDDASLKLNRKLL